MDSESEKLRLDWEELAKTSLKGQNLERVLNRATLEGVDYEGLYEHNGRVLSLRSFPKSFKAATLYDSGLANSQEMIEDQKEGMDSSLLVVRGKNWSKSFSDGLSANFLLQHADDEFLQEFQGKNAFVDSNKLSFENFDSEADRVQKAGLGFAVNMSKVHNAGGSAAQEISYVLNVYNRLLSRGASEDKIFFLAAADSMFFMNIAKLRVLRYLAEELLDAHGRKGRPYIFCVSSLREQTLYDPWVNMLRNCASSMAAVLGGADEAAARPRDAAFSVLTGEPSSSHARRSARHILNIVKEESKLGFVRDSAAGSYAVEEISAQLAAQAWENFLNWEEQDLFLNIKGFAKSVEAIAKSRYEKARSRKSAITGINNFANAEESLEELYGKPWRPVELGAGLFPLRRNALEFEELRLALEKSGKKLKACVVYKGKLAALSARINFLKDVFEILGVQTEELEAGEDLGQTYGKVKALGCDIVALAGKDEEYGQWAKPADPEAFKSQFIAGKKENIDGLAGAENFVDLYMGKNIYRDLKDLLTRQGVEL